MKITRYLPFVALLLFAVLLLAPGGAQAQEPVDQDYLDYLDLYNPFKLKAFELEMTEANWAIIRDDYTYAIYKPALMTVTDENGEETIMVGVRRKSASAFPMICIDIDGNEYECPQPEYKEDDPIIHPDPQKISLKIDINKYILEDENGDVVVGENGETYCDYDYGFGNRAVCVDVWRGVKKLSLENGDDNNVVTEGVAWHLHNLAAQASDGQYTTGKFAWITMDITLTERGPVDPENLITAPPFGVFVSVEQRDKTFLKNREHEGLWADDEYTWLYKTSDPYADVEIKVGPLEESVDSTRFSETLQFKPFQECKRGCLPQPSGDDFVQILNDNINMEGMLTFGAVSAYHISTDDLYSKGKNFYFIDIEGVPDAPKREYIEWDLDGAFGGMDVDAPIYEIGEGKFGDYADWILNDLDYTTVFRNQYTGIMAELVAANGPFEAGALDADLQAFGDMLAPALAVDQYNALDVDDPTNEAHVREYFNTFSDWLAARSAYVNGEVGDPPTTGPTADFSYTATDLTVAFFDESSAGDHPPITWSWDFGDDNTSTDQNPVHPYDAAGSYTVALTVTDSNGGSNTTSSLVTVSDGPVPPTAEFSYTDTDLTVVFSDESSTVDPLDTIVSWSWDFGDFNGSLEQDPTHTYATAGTRTVSLTVTGNNGLSDTTSQSVTVTDPPVGERTFTATGYKVKGVHHVALSWGGFASNVNITGSLDYELLGAPSQGSDDHNTGAKGGWGTYEYTACETESPFTCVNATATAP